VLPSEGITTVIIPSIIQDRIQKVALTEKFHDVGLLLSKEKEIAING
jgi:hypothetical protein